MKRTVLPLNCSSILMIGGANDYVGSNPNHTEHVISTFDLGGAGAIHSASISTSSVPFDVWTPRIASISARLTGS